MNELAFTKTVDAEALHQQLKSALGDAFIGVSVTAQQVIVHLSDTTSDAQLELVRAKVTAHDVTTLPPRPAPKTLDQRFAELEARLQALEQAR
jgi:hypothetical protein